MPKTKSAGNRCTSTNKTGHQCRLPKGHDTKHRTWGGRLPSTASQTEWK